MAQNHDKPAFSLYDASAGSGKTYALVKEYLKIILLATRHDAYRNILAITFTNKAVHEMKGRVLENLSEFAKDTPSDKALKIIKDIARETGLSAIDIREKARNIIKSLIHNYAAFDISTIDKFTHKVIRTFAHDLNLPITFEVSLDTENLLTEAVDALIAEAGNDETLTKLLVDFTMEKADDDKSWDVSREIMDTGRLILNENNREEIAHFSKKTIPEFVSIKDRLLDICQGIEAETANLAQQALELLDKNSIDPKSFAAGHFPNHLRGITEGKFNPDNKTYRESEDIRINKNAADRAIIENTIPDLLAILKNIYSKFERLHFYQAFLKNITPLSLMNTLSNKLQQIQQEQNILSIAEFNKLINEQIQNQPAPFIYERMGEKYRHFFIDEFQDTSQLQWQNLIPLIDNALATEELNGERGSLMIVGDPKQSIYRWRGGKAEQFIALANGENPFANPSRAFFPLKTNWRSYSEVIAFNNDFFKFLASKFENAAYRDLYENRSHQESNDKIGGYVNLSFLPPTEDQQPDEEENPDKNGLYLKAVLATILKVRNKGFLYKDMVVLTRNKKPGTAIANYLTQNGIPIVSSESLLLGASSEVQACIHILRYLKNNNDLESKANYLYYLAKNTHAKFEIHDFIAQGMSLQEEAEFENWLSISGFALSFANLRKKSLYEAAEIIIAKIIPPAKRNAYVQFFLDLVLEHDLRKQSGISDFLAYWDNNSEKLSIPSPEGNDAVRIMTIHKSKGLEFPVVVFPFAEENYSQHKGDKIWIETNEEQLGLPKALVSKNASVEKFGDAALKAYRQKKSEDLLDNVNILYVALTRAEEQLYVISGMNISKNGSLPNNMSSFFIEFLENQGFEENKLVYEFGSPEKVSVATKNAAQTLTIPQLSQTLNPKNIKIAQRESIMWNTRQQKAIEYGNVVHEILSFVNTRNDIETALDKAIENGWIVAETRQTVRQTLDEIVGHKELSDYFSPANQVLNEQAIIQKEGPLLKPDRMAIDKDHNVFLLDYKTGAHLPKHRLQLENYQRTIEEMDFKVVKKALVYIGESIEVVPL